MKKMKNKNLKMILLKINSGIQGMSKESKNESEINKFMLSSSNNTIFVDFHNPNFKEKELFNTIGKFFI
jgi:hypothetical protein